MIRTEVLRTFVTVAEHGNIREAADRLHRTQSAVSMALKQLEDHLGASLFESDRKQTLTDLGEYVLDVARVLLRDHDTAIDRIQRYAAGRSGRLRIASVPSVAAQLMPDILAAFLRERPAAEVDLVDTDSADVRRLVVTGQVDLGIASVEMAATGLQFAPLFEDGMFLVCPASSRLAQDAGPVEWSALQGEALILNETTRAIEAPEFRALAAQTRLRVRNVTSLLAMVSAGVGVTLLPGLATMALPPPLVSRPLADATCKRQVCLLRRSARIESPLASAFQTELTAAITRVIGGHRRDVPGGGHIVQSMTLVRNGES